MPIRQLKWGFLAVAMLFLGIVEWVRWYLYPQLTAWPERFLINGVLLAGILFFFGAIFEVISQIQDRLERQRVEIEALHAAAIDICSDLSLEVVLQKVVDRARGLLDARYGALSVVDKDNHIREFITSGVSPEDRGRIGDPPQGHGLLGVVLHESQHLRLADLTRDSRSVGLPPNHPPMHSLLAVPIVCSSPFRGNLYVAEKRSADEFTEQDEETLTLFAAKARIAIDNASLHRQSGALATAEERLRIAREMHDGMAQVLAYVITKSQVVREYLHQSKGEEASKHLEQIAAAARELYSDAREGIMALRTQLGPELSLTATLEGFLTRWQDQSGIHGELHAEGDLTLPPMAELQLLRIVQEALSNVRKHSEARGVQVDLRRNDGHIEVVVMDDGKGFDLKSRKRSGFPRFGLAIMRERAESIGASFEIDSKPKRGTRLCVRVPIPVESGSLAPDPSLVGLTWEASVGRAESG